MAGWVRGADGRGVGYGRRDVRPDEEAGKGYSGISIWDRIVLMFLFYFSINFSYQKKQLRSLWVESPACRAG